MSNVSYRILPGTNPFVVHSPEDIPADEVRRLFVNVLADFSTFRNPGNSMLHGPRGSGKSMILRYLQPDCQMLERGCVVQDLPFYGVYIGVKRSELGLTELRRLQNSSIDFYLLEHLMVMQVLCRLVLTINQSLEVIDARRVKGLQEFYDGCFLKELQYAGLRDIQPHQRTVNTCSELTGAIFSACSAMSKTISLYLKRIGLTTGEPYDGPICSFSETLLGILGGIRQCRIISEGPIYILIDDADLLGDPLTQVLNSWIASRTTSSLCVKATTQYRYKTFRTPSGNLIETPHDYLELDTSQIYTAKNKRYYNLIEQIVKQRLKAAAIELDPTAYFPPDEKQEASVAEEEMRLRAEWETKGRGTKPADDVSRYARPNYIQRLRGTAKSGSTYSYAGFEQLVNVSSGVYRFFLAPAAEMYDVQNEANQGASVFQISPSIQNRVIREEANRLLFKSFEQLMLDEEEIVSGSENVQQLQNLVLSLGGIFSDILNSDRSERRVISIALTNPPTPQISKILKFGVQMGYFAESTLGNKEGTGRTRRYILSRRLCPAFTLDPYGFAGYLFMANNQLETCMRDPRLAIRTFQSQRLKDTSDALQPSLFDGGESQ